MSIKGENFVELQGFIQYPKPFTTQRGFTGYNAKLVIPGEYTDKGTGETKETKSYLKISAWNDNAEQLAELKEGTAIKIQGVLQERSYDGNCKSCDATEKKYWTSVLVDNFEVVQ